MSTSAHRVGASDRTMVFRHIWCAVSRFTYALFRKIQSCREWMSSAYAFYWRKTMNPIWKCNAFWSTAFTWTDSGHAHIMQSQHARNWIYHIVRFNTLNRWTFNNKTNTFDRQTSCVVSRTLTIVASESNQVRTNQRKQRQQRNTHSGITARYEFISSGQFGIDCLS